MLNRVSEDLNLHLIYNVNLDIQYKILKIPCPLDYVSNIVLINFHFNVLIKSLHTKFGKKNDTVVSEKI